ncbi:MAG: iron ABC transporter substrate-binding protein [Actinobacteria bacterium]|nr:iron ABC transporter substrate-binding protein [Actinomycetota bacterium]MBU1493416.1 iron ABC transporter substrate-binding protein [Actinomycetota bacterium]
MSGPRLHYRHSGNSVSRMRTRILLVAVTVALLATACGDPDATTLTVYSGRSQALVQPLFDRFIAETGIRLEVRYAESVDLAATLAEEGGNSPADVFFAADPASLGAVAAAGLLQPLPERILALVPDRFSDRDGFWVGTSGRSRSVVYDTSVVDPADLPSSLDGFTDPRWRGRLAIAPTNASFVASVAAMILLDGEDATRAWLQGIAANQPLAYPKNSVIVAAVNDGEAQAGLVNHYYLLQLQAEQGETIAANHFLSGGAGALIMPAGAGILATTDDEAAAERFVEFLLADSAQRFFADTVFEFPMVAGIDPNRVLPALSDLSPPDLDLSDLAEVLDLATDLIAEAGLL